MEILTNFWRKVSSGVRGGGRQDGEWSTVSWIWLQRGPASQSKMLGPTPCELEEDGHQQL